MFINNLEKRENFKNVNFPDNSILCWEIKMRADIKLYEESCITDWFTNKLPGAKKESSMQMK